MPSRTVYPGWHVSHVHESQPRRLRRHADEALQGVSGRAIEMAGLGLEVLAAEIEVG